MATKAKLKKSIISAEAPFIIARLRESKMLEEHGKYLLTTGVPGQAIKFQVVASFGLQVSMHLSDSGKQIMAIVIGGEFAMRKEEPEATPIAEVKLKYVFVYEIDRVIGKIDVGVPSAAIQPYTHLGTMEIASRARDIFSSMGLPSVAIQVPESFERNDSAPAPRKPKKEKPE